MRNGIWHRALVFLTSIMVIALVLTACDLPAIDTSGSVGEPAVQAPTAEPLLEPTQPATAVPDTGAHEPAPADTGSDEPASTGTPGWYLVDTTYFQSPSDVDILGGPVKSTMTGTSAGLSDYYRDEGSPNNIVLSHTRVADGGNVVATATWRVAWTDPAPFLPAGQTASLEIEHELVADWGTPSVTTYFDVPDMQPGHVSSSPIPFVHPHGEKTPYRDTREEVRAAKETVTSREPLPEGKPGDSRAIYLHFGEGYGMRYTYQWAEAPLGGPGSGSTEAATSDSDTGAANAPGWYLVDTTYFQSPSDVDILGGPVKSTMTGTSAGLSDYYRDEGSPNNIVLSHTRVADGGNVVATATWRVAWTDPAPFLPAGQTASLEIEHELVADWGTPSVTTYFDVPDMQPGHVSSSPIPFVHPHGEKTPYRDTREEVRAAKETVTSREPLPEGKPGDSRAIYLHFGEGYGMRYTYQWRP